MRLTYFPAFQSSEALLHQVVRACWYLKHLPLEAITFYLEGGIEHRFELPEFYDPSIAQDYQSLQDQGVLRFVPGPCPQQLQTDAVIAWGDLDGAHALAAKSRVEHVFNVDFQHRMEGSFYVDVVDRLANERQSSVALGEQRLQALKDSIGPQQDAYLFCTGPSVTEYERYRLNGGVSIICNSVINDEELMRAVRPRIHVFADPIFHFGCSRYAFEFRKKLLEVSEKYDLTHIVPIKYWSLFKQQLPELADRSLPVPFSHDEPINLDLSKRFLLKTTDNILTFLMLPLATTLADRVWLFGCDGRPLSDDSYFWNHNSRVQFDGEMSSIQDAHPSFFKLDYNEYYLRHCTRLEEYLTAGEQEGVRFVSASFSHIPALADRAFALRPEHTADLIYLSINPDLVGEFGHFMHMDNRIAEAAGDLRPTLSIANQAAEIAGTATKVVPHFSANTWSARTRTDAEDPLIVKFQTELRLLAEQAGMLRAPKAAYMYTGDVSHLAGMLGASEALQRADVEVHLNLFFSSFDVFAEDFETSLRFHFYQSVLAQYSQLDGSAIQLYVESEKTQKRLHALFGVDCRIWPMINITEESRFAAAAARPGKRTTPRVLFPGTGQLSKGIDTACDAIAQYLGAQLPPAEFVLRDLQKDTEQNNETIRAGVDSLRKHAQVTVLDGVLTEDDYAQLYAHADVIVVPYRWNAFHARTSAAVVDALYFGIPVVVTASTWLSDEAIAFDLCVPFEDGNAHSLRQAIATALTISPAADRQAHRQHWRERYSAQRLLEAFHGADAVANIGGATQRLPAEEMQTMTGNGSDNPETERPDSDSVTALKALLSSQAARSDALDVAESLVSTRAQLQAQITDLRAQVASLESQLENAPALTAATTPGPEAAASNRDLYQKFDRTLTREELEVLQGKWLPILKLDMTTNSLAYAADLICGVEARSVGRLASGIQDAVLRSLVARASAQDDRLSYLEIGSLFGVNMCTVYELTRYELASVHMSSIDPLDSYYNQAKDVLTGMPISEAIVKRNLQQSDIPQADYRLIKHLSTEDAALKAASSASYHCLLIDGDHSYDGVKNDFDLFSGLLRDGGYLIVDDYGAKEWPDVTRFVDESIRNDPKFSFVGHDWRTIVFRYHST